AQVNRNRPNRSATNGHKALLGALAEYAYKMILQHHISDAERNPLRDAKSRAVSQLEHRPVAKCQRLVERWSRQQLLDLLNTQHLGQGPPTLGCLQALTRIAHDVSFPQEKLEVGADGRDI